MSRDQVPFGHPWDETLLGEIADVVVGGTPSTTIPSFWDGQVRWMVSGDVHQRHIFDVPGRITESGLHHSNAVVVPPKAVAMAMAGQGKTRGTVALTFIPICTNQSVALIKPHEIQLDATFLYQSLIMRYEEMRGRSAGGGRAGLSKSIIEQVPVQLPPFPEQCKIASILTTVDNLIEKTEALIAKYQAIKQGMMHDLFTRGVDAHGQLRPPYEEAPELYKDSELGWIPREWEVNPLQRTYIRIKRGPSLSTNLQGIGIRYLTSDNITADGRLDWDVRKHLNVLPSSLSSILEIDDVLLNCVNSEEQIGKTSYVDSLPEPTTVGFNNFALTFDSALVSPRFGYYQLTSERFHKLLRQTVKPAINQASFSSADIKDLPFAQPHLEEQKKIASRLDSTTSYILAELRLLSKLREKKTGLMQDLLTGNVRVTVDEPQEVMA